MNLNPFSLFLQGVIFTFMFNTPKQQDFMLSQKLHDALNAQVNAELWSAYLYLSMSMDAEAKGLKGVANWFYVQFCEEQAHARIFMNYINSRDAKVELKPIDEVPTTWDSALDMFKETLNHERTQSDSTHQQPCIYRQ